MNSFATGFLGSAPRWFAATVLAMLAANILLFAFAGPAACAWAALGEFIFTLAMALRCHPLAPGGLIALEAVLLGLTSPEQIRAQTQEGFSVILLLLFLVTAVYFMRDLLIHLFSRLFVRVRSQALLAFSFCLGSALLSAFLDALTVLAVLISVVMGFHAVYREHLCRLPEALHTGAAASDGERFHAALRGLLMHAAVGTALGGVTTLVGEPQNLLIGNAVNWNFQQFFIHTAPVSMPVLAAGLATCLLVDRLKIFGYGVAIPESVRNVLIDADLARGARRTTREMWGLRAQAVCGVLLVAGLGFHLAEPGLIGLMTLVLLTAALGVSDEDRLAEGFKGALPFTALLVVFFAIAAVIRDQALFRPVIDWVLARDPATQPGWLFLANGLLSAVSDNVFVASVYMSELQRAAGTSLISNAQFSLLAVAVNAGTNIPSVATPNGQAAFLYLLTSAIAPLLRLSYARMVWMAFPYFIVTSAVGLVCVNLLRP